jgi:hypothetical protein
METMRSDSFEETIFRHVGDADQFGSESTGFGLDDFRHLYRVIDGKLVGGCSSVLAPELPGVGEDVLHHAPWVDETEEVIERLPGESLAGGIVKNVGGAAA